MYDYKTIGTTAAKVVSVLAVAGGLLWYQRTVTPVDIPRPQDEAVLMHAILERHAMMGRTNGYFGKAYTANVSKIIITNVWSNQIGGTWYDDPAHTGTIFNVYSNLTNSVAHTDTNTVSFYPNAVYAFPFALRYAFANHNFSWAGNFLAPDNTWGPPRIYFDYPTTPNDYSGKTGWLVPEDAYMISGDTSWFGTMPMTNVWTAPATYYYSIYDSPYNYMHVLDFVTNCQKRAMYVWTNFVTKPEAHWSTNGIFAYTNIVYTNFPPATNWFWQTNVTHAMTNFPATNYWNTYVITNSSYGTNRHELSAMLFPFERDYPFAQRYDPFFHGDHPDSIGKKKDVPVKYWSTNSYNDMARALSLLQWVREYRAQAEAVKVTTWFENPGTGATFWYTEYETNNPSVREASIVSYDRDWYFRIESWVLRYTFTNSHPFAAEHVWFIPDSVTTNGLIPDTWGVKPGELTSVAPGAGGVTEWWPLSPDDMAAWQRGFEGWITGDPKPDMHVSCPCVCFHAVFQSLTNYTQYGSPR